MEEGQERGGGGVKRGWSLSRRVRSILITNVAMATSILVQTSLAGFWTKQNEEHGIQNGERKMGE